MFQKLEKALPFITTTAGAITVWSLFALWIVKMCTTSYNLLTYIVITFVGLAFAGSATWESIKAYRKWKGETERWKNYRQ